MIIASAFQACKSRLAIKFVSSLARYNVSHDDIDHF
jgi:hypothetical protein